jgi:hypothetical protein
MSPPRNPSSGGFDHVDASGGIPDFEEARTHVRTELVRFTNQLRREGVDVPATGTLDASRALGVVGFADRTVAADALRATIVTETADIEAFDEAFPTFWHRLRTGLDRIATYEGPRFEEDADSEGPTVSLEADDREETPRVDDPDSVLSPDAGEDGAGPDAVDVLISTGRRHATSERPVEDGDAGEDARRYSAVGAREAVPSTALATSDRDRAAIDRFGQAIATVPGRRTAPAENGSRIDGRQALRKSLSTGGTPMELPTREAVPTERRCCLLVDVSGSVLDTIDRDTLLAFAERLQGSARRGHVFLFDTDLVDATDVFARAGGDPAAALQAAEIEWGGGTQIGAAFETIRRQHPHAVDNRTVVVVVSDGLDVGDGETLTAGITWLARRADAIVWLNPLAVSPAYEPTSRGMATCLPFVDGLFGFSDPADLDEAARQIERRGLGGQVGYEHDPRRIQQATNADTEGDRHTGGTES